MGDSRRTLAVSEDLDLSQVSVPQIPPDILFPNELNQYLRDQVQYLTHENGMLCKNLSEAELQLNESTGKIKTLNSQLEDYQALCPKNSLTEHVSATTFASAKIIELGKQLRERNSQLEVYKTKCSKLEQKIVELEGTAKPPKPPVSDPTPADELEEQLKNLQEKLSGTKTKLHEARNSNTQLKNDLKLANKFLQQEIGDSFDTIQGLHGGNGWRGRAQVICDLQQKNSELKEKLKAFNEKEKNQGVPVKSEQTQSKFDKRLENLSQENEQLRASVQDHKKKLEAARARGKVYDSECCVLRTKLAAITEENERNHQLMTSLTGKITQAQDVQNEAVHKKQLVIQKLQQANADLQLKLTKQTYKLDNLHEQLNQQRTELENLHNKQKHRTSTSPKLSPPQDRTYNQLEAERLRLLELTQLANERLEAERKSHSETQSKFRSERQRAAKLEAKVARLELDNQTGRSSTYSTRSRESNCNLEDRLELAEETIKALETRLQLERHEHNVDIEEFSKILKNYGYVQNVDANLS